MLSFLSSKNDKRLKTTPFFTTGFTLVETLLAIAILTMAVIAPLSIASQGLAAATTGKDRFIATALAREAIEYVRNVRDTNRLLNTDNVSNNDVDWLDGLDSCLNGNECVVDVISSHGELKKLNLRSQSGKKNGLIGVDSVTGLYGYAPSNNPNDSWDDSKFTRYVSIKPVWVDVASGEVKEVQVTATVTWQTLFSTKQVVIIGDLVNW